MNKITTLLLTLMPALMIGIGASSAATESRQYANEKEIEFTPRKGEPVSAFEGYLYVPENRNNANSRKIRIDYVRFPATGKVKGNPIVYLAGGPGGPGSGTAKGRRFPMFMALRKYGDVIA